MLPAALNLHPYTPNAQALYSTHMDSGIREPVLARIHKVMQLREEVETLGVGGEYQPAADWQDDGEYLTLLLDVPGCTAETLHLEHEEDAVTVSGKRSEAQSRLVHRERRTGAFSRRLPFPESVVVESAQAGLQAGVLSVRFEKVHKTIDVDG